MAHQGGASEKGARESGGRWSSQAPRFRVAVDLSVCEREMGLDPSSSAIFFASTRLGFRVRGCGFESQGLAGWGEGLGRCMRFRFDAAPASHYAFRVQVVGVRVSVITCIRCVVSSGIGP